MNKNTIAIGKLAGTHGVKGELKLRLYALEDEIAEYMDLLDSGLDTFTVGDKPCEVIGVRAHKRVILLMLKGISSKNDADPLIGKEVFIDKDVLPVLPEGEYYEFELLGMDVWAEGEGGDAGTEGEELAEVYGAAGNRGKQYLGKIVNLLTTGSNDVYEVEGPLGEVLLPAIDDVIRKIDIDKKEMIVRLMEGILPEPASED